MPKLFIPSVYVLCLPAASATVCRSVAAPHGAATCLLDATGKPPPLLVFVPAPFDANNYLSLLSLCFKSQTASCLLDAAGNPQSLLGCVPAPINARNCLAFWSHATGRNLLPEYRDDGTTAATCLRACAFWCEQLPNLPVIFVSYTGICGRGCAERRGLLPACADGETTPATRLFFVVWRKQLNILYVYCIYSSFPLWGGIARRGSLPNWYGRKTSALLTSLPTHYGVRKLLALCDFCCTGTSTPTFSTTNWHNLASSAARLLRVGVC